MQDIEALSEHIAAYADEVSARKLYAIVDLARLDTPRDRLAQLKRTPGACNLFAGQPEASAETLAPWLWPIAAEQRGPRLVASLSLERTTSAAVSWIATTLSAHEIARRLTQRMAASLNVENALFRFYDPRLLPVVATHLSDAERASFFGLGNGRWFLIDERDDLTHIALHDVEGAFRPPVRISNHLASALQDAANASRYWSCCHAVGRRNGPIGPHTADVHMASLYCRNRSSARSLVFIARPGIAVESLRASPYRLAGSGWHEVHSTS